MSEKFLDFVEFLELFYDKYVKEKENVIAEEIKMFRGLYPLDELGDLTLEQYDKLNNKKSFMNLIENGTNEISSGSLGSNHNKYFYHDKKSGNYMELAPKHFKKYDAPTIEERFNNYIKHMKEYIVNFKSVDHFRNTKNMFLPNANIIKTKLILLYHDDLLLSIGSKDKLYQISNYFKFKSAGKNKNSIQQNLYLIEQIKKQDSTFFNKYPNKIIVGHLMFDYVFKPLNNIINLDDIEDPNYKQIEEISPLIEPIKEEHREAPQLITVNKKQRYPRDHRQKQIAVNLSNNKCAFDDEHFSFISKGTNQKYLEAHHVVPRNEQDSYIYDIDDYKNIILLCSNCHNLIHYGLFKDKKRYLDKIYKEREEDFKKLLIRKDGKVFNKNLLYEYYK